MRFEETACRFLKVRNCAGNQRFRTGWSHLRRSGDCYKRTGDSTEWRLRQRRRQFLSN